MQIAKTLSAVLIGVIFMGSSLAPLPDMRLHLKDFQSPELIKYQDRPAFWVQVVPHENQHKVQFLACPGLLEMNIRASTQKLHGERDTSEGLEIPDKREPRPTPVNSSYKRYEWSAPHDFYDPDILFSINLNWQQGILLNIHNIKLDPNTEVDQTLELTSPFAGSIDHDVS